MRSEENGGSLRTRSPPSALFTSSSSLRLRFLLDARCGSHFRRGGPANTAGDARDLTRVRPPSVDTDSLLDPRRRARRIAERVDRPHDQEPHHPTAPPSPTPTTIGTITRFIALVFIVHLPSCLRSPRPVANGNAAANPSRTVTLTPVHARCRGPKPRFSPVFRRIPPDATPRAGRIPPPHDPTP